MKIDVVDRQKLGRPNKRKIRQLARQFAMRVSRAAQQPHWRELSIVLTDDDEMVRLNSRYLGRPETTDVLSFRYDPLPGDPESMGAEIVVNVAQALREGARHGGASRELALYIAHGCDHLLGENDTTRESRLRMRRRELRWLNDAASRGLLNGLIPERTAR